MKSNAIIRCPHCGMEYLMGEIYVGSAFIGKPLSIKRDSLGRIIDFIGNDVDAIEYYCCDNCDTPFKIETPLPVFTTTELTETEFEEAVKPKITKKELF